MKPTDERKRRYPHGDPTKDGYNLDFLDQDDPEAPGVACTCEPNCAKRCAGECGCEACWVTFAEFCDEANLDDVSNDEAKQRYRENF